MSLAGEIVSFSITVLWNQSAIFMRIAFVFSRRYNRKDNQLQTIIYGFQFVPCPAWFHQCVRSLSELTSSGVGSCTQGKSCPNHHQSCVGFVAHLTTTKSPFIRVILVCHHSCCNFSSGLHQNKQVDSRQRDCHYIKREDCRSRMFLLHNQQPMFNSHILRSEK